MYGGTAMKNMNFQGPYGSSNQPPQQSQFTKHQRKRLNIVALLIALFAPWALFCIVYAIMTFSMHYTSPIIMYAIVVLAFLGGVALPALLAANAMKRKLTDPTYQPSWYLFLAGTCFIAFIVAVVLGEENYTNNMQKYYNLEHLSQYNDIDTNLYLGQQLVDAGRINFKEGTALDLGHSMGFKNNDIYCVSPIKTKGSPNNAVSVDFWAVGKNCCSGVSADFHCPGFSDPQAKGVIRLMHDEDRPFYRLAVQQAEATYKITATHPLFFEWVRSADDATNAFAQTGRVNFFLGICSYFVFQAFIVAVTTVSFSKLMHY